MLLLKRLGQQGLERVRWQVVAPCMVAGTRGMKQTTGIVGLAVDPEARTHLKEKLESILDTLKMIPADVLYRKHVEALVQPRLADIKSDMTDEEIESKYGLQLEEHIELCNDELGLIPHMAGVFVGWGGAWQGCMCHRVAHLTTRLYNHPQTEWKPWEVPEGYVVRVCVGVKGWLMQRTHSCATSHRCLRFQRLMLKHCKTRKTPNRRALGLRWC